MLRKQIIIVSGLPRSGTSLMMNMLQAGGIPILADDLRKADIDNPKGYLEFEPVKSLNKQSKCDWLSQAKGKAVKVVSILLKYLPDDYQYKVIFMRRRTKEILASQSQMIQNQGKNITDAADLQNSRLFEKHLETTLHWLQQNHMDHLEVDYNSILEDPENTIAPIPAFLNQHNIDLDSMISVIDPSLYRNIARQSARLDSSISTNRQNSNTQITQCENYEK